MVKLVIKSINMRISFPLSLSLSIRSYEDQNLTSLNTGAVEIFNLDFLSFRFDSLNYSVLEGDTLRSVH